MKYLKKTVRFETDCVRLRTKNINYIVFLTLIYSFFSITGKNNKNYVE